MNPRLSQLSLLTRRRTALVGPCAFTVLPPRKTTKLYGAQAPSVQVSRPFTRASQAFP